MSFDSKKEESDMKIKKTDFKGIKKMRNHPTAKPDYYCPNCKCHRYSTCYCKQKEERK